MPSIAVNCSSTAGYDLDVISDAIDEGDWFCCAIRARITSKTPSSE